MDDDLEMTKVLINSILTANDSAMSLGQLEAEYKALENEFIPYKKFGYTSLIEFLASCPKHVRISYSHGSAQLSPVVSESVKHIRDFVENQRKDPTKKVSYKVSRDVEERILRLLANSPNHRLLLSHLSNAYSRAYGSPLPGPRGRLVPWLSTSNNFAIIGSDKNAKFIEPLSGVDLNKYKRARCQSQTPFPVSAAAAQNTGWHSAASGDRSSSKGPPYRSNTSVAPTTSTKTFGNKPGSGQTRSPTYTAQSTAYTPQPTAYTPQPPAYTPQPTAYGTQNTSHVPRPPSPSVALVTQPLRDQPSTSPAEGPPTAASNPPRSKLSRALTSEDHELLLRLMMKNPENTSVHALHRGYEHHRERIDVPTFLAWLCSMEECILIGEEKGKVFVRSNYRSKLGTAARLPTAAAAAASAATVAAPSVTAPSTAGAPSAPASSSAPPPASFSGSLPKETLKVTIQQSQSATSTGSNSTNGWHRTVETTVRPSSQASSAAVASQQTNGKPPSGAYEHHARTAGLPADETSRDVDRVLQGVCDLSATDIIDVVQMMWRYPKIPLDQLLAEFEMMFERELAPTGGVEALVLCLNTLGLLKVATNSDVSLWSPVQLRMFEFERGQWLDVSADDNFWSSYMQNGLLNEGRSMTGTVVAYTDVGFTFVPKWSLPNHSYKPAEVELGGSYVYINEGRKLRAIAQASISKSGHWVVYLPDLRRSKPCRKEQLFIGAAQPIIDVIPIGRCPPVGEHITLKIVYSSPSLTFVCVDNEEVCSVVTSKVDPKFTFRVLHWDNQRFIPRGDLSRLNLDKGLTAMDLSAIGYGDYLAAGSWMKDMRDEFFIPMTEFVELLEEMGFQEDVIHDLLLI